MRTASYTFIRSFTLYRILQLATLFPAYLFHDDFILGFRAVTNSSGRWVFYCINFQLQDYEYDLQLCSSCSKFYGPSKFVVNESYRCKRTRDKIVICPLPLYDQNDIYVRLLGWKGKENKTSDVYKVPDSFYCDWESVRPHITSVEPLNKRTTVTWEFEEKWTSSLDVTSTLFYSANTSHPRNAIHTFKCNKNTNLTSNNINFPTVPHFSNWKCPPRCKNMEQPSDELSNRCTFSKWFSLYNSCAHMYTICIKFEALNCDNSYVMCTDRRPERDVIEAPQLSCSMTRNNDGVDMLWNTKNLEGWNEPYRYHYQLHQRGKLIEEKTTSEVRLRVSSKKFPLVGKVKACTSCLCSEFSEINCNIKAPVLKPHSDAELTVPIVSSVGVVSLLIFIVILFYLHKTCKKRIVNRKDDANVLDEDDVFKNEDEKESDLIFPLVYEEIKDKVIPHNYNGLAKTTHNNEIWIDTGANQYGFLNSIQPASQLNINA